MRQAGTVSWGFRPGFTGTRPATEERNELEVRQAPAFAQPSRLRLGRVAGVTTSLDARLVVSLHVDERVLEYFGDLETQVLEGGMTVPLGDLWHHIGSDAIVIYHREGQRRIIESIAVEAWFEA